MAFINAFDVCMFVLGYSQLSLVSKRHVLGMNYAVLEKTNFHIRMR